MTTKFPMTFNLTPANIPLITAIVGLLEGEDWHDDRDVLLAVVRLEYAARRRYPLLPWPQLPPADIPVQLEPPARDGIWIGEVDLTSAIPDENTTPPDEAELQRRRDLIQQARADLAAGPARMTTLAWFVKRFGNSDGRRTPKHWRHIFGRNTSIQKFAQHFAETQVSRSPFNHDPGVGQTSYKAIRAALIQDGYLNG